jgi:hypothetical protein
VERNPRNELTTTYLEDQGQMILIYPLELVKAKKTDAMFLQKTKPNYNILNDVCIFVSLLMLNILALGIIGKTKLLIGLNNFQSRGQSRH